MNSLQGSENLTPPANAVEKGLHSPNGSTALNSSLEHGSSQRKRLRLEILESQVLSPGSELLITPSGLEGINHRPSDGIVYAGSSDTDCDLVIKDDSTLMGRRQFMVYWKEGTCYLKDMGEGSGTFVRVNGSTTVSSGSIVSFGDCHMLVLVEDTTLVLKQLTGEKIGQELPFLPSSSPVLIGRAASCAVHFPDKCLSRYQCSFVYDPQTQTWKLYDGLNSCKPSSNGTWVLHKEGTELVSGLVFKSGSTVFKASILV